MTQAKNNFIISIIALVLIIFVSIFGYGYYVKNLDKESFVVLVSGKGMKNDKLLKIDKREKLFVGDTVRTIGESSVAVLEWGDGSVTRLSGEAKVTIDEAYVSGDLSKMNISFSLFSGKSWSNVISFFGDGSYFKENFTDVQATVRGTTFNVDLTKDYLYVIDHKLDLTTGSGKTITVNQGQPFRISDFSWIDLQNFIQTIKDKAWEDLNKKYDNEFFSKLKQEVYKNIAKLNEYKDIDVKQYLSDNLKKQEMYNKLLTEYQQLNFVTSEDGDLFKLKLELKDKLIQLADNKNKAILVTSTLYDFKSVLESKVYDQVDLMLNMLSTNKEILSNIDMQKYFEGVIIPDDIKIKINDKFGELKEFFMNTFNTINGFGIDDIKNLHDKASDIIQNGLNNLINNK